MLRLAFVFPHRSFRTSFGWSGHEGQGSVVPWRLNINSVTLHLLGFLRDKFLKTLWVQPAVDPPQASEGTSLTLLFEFELHQYHAGLEHSDFLVHISNGLVVVNEHQRMCHAGSQWTQLISRSIFDRGNSSLPTSLPVKNVNRWPAVLERPIVAAGSPEAWARVPG